MGRKPGVMEPDELRKFVEQAGDKLIVVDARNPDFAVEPGDEGTHATGGIPGLAGGGGPDRPRAVNAPYDRAQSCLDLSKIPAEWVEAGARRPRTTCWQTASKTSPTAAGPRTPSAGPSLAASKVRRAARASVAGSLSRGQVVLSVGVRCTWATPPQGVATPSLGNNKRSPAKTSPSTHHTGRKRRPQSDP